MASPAQGRARANALERLKIGWLGLRNRLIADPAFQRRAASLPFVRAIAARRARALFDICAGFVYSQVLLACVRLSLFEKLADGPLEPDALADELDLPREAADRRGTHFQAGELRLQVAQHQRRFAHVLADHLPDRAVETAVLDQLQRRDADAPRALTRDCGV